MSEASQRQPMTMKTVVYEVAEMAAVTERRDVEYRPGLTLDVYLPPGATDGAHRPAVVFVSGYPDEGFEQRLGCKLKDMGQYVSWARLVAASGLVGITYTNREPVADLDALLPSLREQAPSLGIDAERIGLWAGSGNVPVALAAILRHPIRCAALCYGYMFGDETATASAAIGFVNPIAGKTIDDLPATLPLFIARAGADQTPQLNETIDRFVAAALARNLPVTVANHATGPHAFDLMDASERSRQLIRQVLEFLRFELGQR